MKFLSLIPALIFAIAGLVAIFVLLRPLILAIKPLVVNQKKKRPHLYQVKIERKNTTNDDKPDDIVYH